MQELNYAEITMASGGMPQVVIVGQRMSDGEKFVYDVIEYFSHYNDFNFWNLY